MSTHPEKNRGRGPALRALASLVLIGVSLAYGWSTLSKYTRGMPPLPPRPIVMPTPAGPAPPKPTPDLRQVMPTTAERREIMAGILSKVSVSDDQRKKLEEIWITGPQSPEALGQRIEDSRKVLTEQQAMAMAPMFMAVVAARVERARKLMNTRDFTSLQRRLQGMAQQKNLNPLAK